MDSTHGHDKWPCPMWKGISRLHRGGWYTIRFRWLLPVRIQRCHSTYTNAAALVGLFFAFKSRAVAQHLHFRFFGHPH